MSTPYPQVLKYDLFNLANPMPLSNIEMPIGAKTMKVGIQPRKNGLWVCLWALVNPDAPTEERTFVQVATGKPIEFDGVIVRPLETFVFDGPVIHVIELVPEPTFSK